MANAIPVSGSGKKVKVAPAASPTLDDNGNVVPGDYAAKEREGTEGAAAKRKPKARFELANGAIRSDW